MGTYAIRAEGLSKSFKIHHIHKVGLREMLERVIRTPWKQASSAIPVSRSEIGQMVIPTSETIWALKDVSFEIDHGEVVGFLGHNGAGKSVLLKILAQVVAPTKGRCHIYGKLDALLEVGTGFHPELTGRENILLSGAILGMKRAEIERKFDEIVAFSGVEKFLDTPVKRYSSGMRVRLAFAVAVHLEPDILLIDEVLAVGDQDFIQQCIGKLKTLAESGRTLIFVSHQMQLVERLCSRALIFQRGQLTNDGPCREIVKEYTAMLQTSGERQAI